VAVDRCRMPRVDVRVPRLPIPSRRVRSGAEQCGEGARVTRRRVQRNWAGTGPVAAGEGSNAVRSWPIKDRVQRDWVWMDSVLRRDQSTRARSWPNRLGEAGDVGWALDGQLGRSSVRAGESRNGFGKIRGAAPVQSGSPGARSGRLELGPFWQGLGWVDEIGSGDGGCGGHAGRRRFRQQYAGRSPLLQSMQSNQRPLPPAARACRIGLVSWRAMRTLRDASGERKRE
jgi:hypothetical protein